MTDNPEGIRKRFDDAVIRKRFDDAYRSLLAVSGIYAFAFANYAKEPFSTFIYKIGIPFTLTAVVIWTMSHIYNRDWEYNVKLIGFTLAWFGTFGLLSIVYLKDIAGITFGMKGWFVCDLVVTLLFMLVVGRLFESTGITTRRYTIFLIAFALFVGFGSYFLMLL